jgi:hypothetical protein
MLNPQIQSMMPGGMPPSGAPEQQGSLRDMIVQAMQNGQLPQEIGQQALAMLDQGSSEQEVMQWLEQALQQASGGQMEQGELTLEQAMQMLQQGGAPPEAIQQLQAIVQQGTPVEQALQQVMLSFSQVMG